MSFVWGLLGPETIYSIRRTRTLGLASVVRYFNDRAVPGLGGIWYGKQLMLALLGIVVAEHAKQQDPKFNASNTQVANAIEALACWSALKSTDYDPRLRGSETLLDKPAKDFVFINTKKQDFYPTQPMRMQTVQPLPALGFVTALGRRFNSFTPTQEGRAFVKAACEVYRPYNRDVVSHLTQWVLGQDNRVNTDALSSALSPLVAMPDEARWLLRERLKQGSTELHNALAWIETLKDGQANIVSFELQRPEKIEETHWRDIWAGSLFLPLHDLAIAVLNAVEAGMGPDCSLNNGAKKAKTQLQALKDASEDFLRFKYTTRLDAVDFCNQCVGEPVNALLALVQRDEKVLRWDGKKILRGPAFHGHAVQESDYTQEPAGSIPMPMGLFYRFYNLFLLHLDLNKELDDWMKRGTNDAAA